MAMSDAGSGEKKKGGKLPIIIVLVLVLAGGGFFATRGKGGEKKEEPKKEAPKLGEVAELGEFTVNLRGSASNFLRAKISVHMDKSVDVKHMEKALPALQDVAITVLSRQSLEELLTDEGKEALRRELAKYMNERMALVDEHVKEHMKELKEKKEEEREAEEEKRKEEAEKEGKEYVPSEEHSEKESKPEYPELDSDYGPVFKVYLTDFAMQ